MACTWIGEEYELTVEGNCPICNSVFGEKYNVFPTHRVMDDTSIGYPEVFRGTLDQCHAWINCNGPIGWDIEQLYSPITTYILTKINNC